MNILDWVLVVLAATYALSGYWQGFITGAFATSGLLLGGLAGVWLAPLALGDAGSSLLVSLAAVFIVIACASVGQAVLQWTGAKVRDRVTWRPARAVDAVGGAALSAAAVLLVAWALGVAVSGTRIPGVTNQVRSSTVLAEVDRLLPTSADNALEGFNTLVGASVFPRYLEPFDSETIVAVDPGDDRILRRPGVAAAASSVVRVTGVNSCGEGVEGTGFVYADGKVMTNAHVVAGITDPDVDISGTSRSATVVLYDPDLDIAVLDVDTGTASPLDFDDTAAGDTVAIAGYPLDGPYDVRSARVRAEQRLRSPDIYGDGTVLREVYSLRGLVRPGNSGGPILDGQGDVVGVVFAASVTDSDTGYALTADQVAQAAQAGESADTAVSTGACAS
ncbi:MarP family serine protease [Nocardioides sp. GY 10127]|uniref:MarP family serine protease n=1 Tax=Nocardioides sp. GY 10127 TaxID=2569762 RepID=UPI0010A7BCAC|nr:MarP family serine protease [Nocardioides sp. GY 10127]TIC83320.1 MarP family serine protease [Nocardioides sp. GY 10127]